jgi:hypothetical protein
MANKINFNDLTEVQAYAQKLGKSMVILDGENSRGNYNIIPLCRPDLFLKPSVAIIWLPENWREVWAKFNFNTTPQLQPFVVEGLAKLETFAV